MCCITLQRKTDISTIYIRFIITVSFVETAFSSNVQAVCPDLRPAAFHEVLWNCINLVFHLNLLLSISHHFN